MNERDAIRNTSAVHATADPVLYEPWEGERLYRALFATPAPPVLGERCAQAIRAIRATRPADEVARHRMLLARVADLEALEYAARLLGRHPLLVAEAALVVRLAETVPENLPCFVSGPVGRPRALAVLAAAVARSAFKLAKGVVVLTWGAGRA